MANDAEYTTGRGNVEFDAAARCYQDLLALPDIDKLACGPWQMYRSSGWITVEIKSNQGDVTA